MKKMGLFGGTFDPVHQGHIDMAMLLARSLSLDGVILMPTLIPPHKTKEQTASAADRLYMCRLAVAGYPLLEVSDLELRRGGASFTIDTLETLRKKYPDTSWYLFTGADMFCTLRTWHRFKEIARMVTLCTVPRVGTDMAHLHAYADSLKADGFECFVADRPVQDISSSVIRDKLAAGEDVSEFVSPAVMAYMRAHGLYQRTVTVTFKETCERLRSLVESRLSRYRFSHSLNVANEAEQLARHYGADRKMEETVYIAGILHDIMKETDPNTQLQILSDFGILLDEVEQQSPKLWHARSGEAFIRHILNIEDEDVLRAVRYHTTGRAGMTFSEKVLFVADFTSKDRDYPDVDVMRRLSRSSLEEAMEYGIAYTIRELQEQGCPIHPDTLAAYDDIVLSLEEGNRNEK